MQSKLDQLYMQSKNGNNFYKLTKLMESEENIRLAYRNIKKNMGSHTAGVDGYADHHGSRSVGHLCAVQSVL